jgi:KDO2-lipid IV(A) lauroyltransferase
MNGPFALAALCGLARALPLRLGTELGGTLACFHARLSTERRRAARRNLAAILSDESKAARHADDAVRHYGRFLVELLRGPDDPSVRFEAKGLEILDAALARGRGIVLVIPHMGNWEIAGAALARRGTPVTSVAGVQLRPDWTREIRRRRARAGLTIVDASGEGLRLLGAAIQRNEIVALHVDGDRFRTGVPVSIAGRAACLPPGPARLAIRHGAALVFGVCVRMRDGRHVGRVVREIPLDSRDSGAVERATRELARLLEEAIREHPEQWIVFREMFAPSSETTDFSTLVPAKGAS